MKTAIRDSALHEALDRTFDIAKNLGFTGIDVTLGRRNTREHPMWTRAGLRGILDHRNSTRLDIPCINVERFESMGLAHPNARVREGAGKVLNALIPRAAALGTWAVVVPLDGRGQPFGRVRQKTVAEVLRDVAPAAESHGMGINIRSAADTKVILRLLDDVGSETVRVEHDIAHSVLLDRDPAADIRALGGAVAQVRLRDIDAGGSLCPLGVGTVAYQPIVEALDEIDFDGYVVVDTPHGADTVAAAAANLAFVHEYFLWT
ncbi:sugar phosphate isomerase/epimerase [Candidatus Poribacteria bacterium]|jgi:sugar phosphate isomerase/epimerase|nr:sugar phosphate isomerase/epimerase [Candidatus Poribacteria bacterium]MBT5536247.1 sugar phosphate isomerase/epimerase [Candidatus Poribacteria bacterium]MBT5711075.1 sugar phosphate isomerase/epimerase [Candidatus Poribacteria bacterium]MBT7096565.1 sugar phosphate isomerase/epimerase [Candidatus Poribacteria bacterium]MBT7808162.1 sugar phosphate isomerase/epimerase [Candidatus Poribacteria bacterium]